MAFLEGENFTGKFSELTIVNLTARGSGESSREYARSAASAAPVAKKFTFVGESFRTYSSALSQLLKTDTY